MTLNDDGQQSIQHAYTWCEASAEENLIDCDMEESGDANAAAAAGSEVPLVT